MTSPPRARPTEAQVELAHCRSSWSPEEVAQALADEYAKGVRAGVDLVLAEVDDWYQHPAGMLLERIRSLKGKP